MDFLSCLEQSLTRLFGERTSASESAAIEYIESFESGHRPRGAVALDTGLADAEAAIVLRCADRLLRQAQFDTGAGPDFIQGELNASFSQTLSGEEGWLAHETQVKRPLTIRYQVRLGRDQQGRMVFYATHKLPAFSDQFLASLAQAVRATPENLVELAKQGASSIAPQPRMAANHTLLAPGQPLDRPPAAGQLLDYSGCATPDDVVDLTAGTLPLGRYAFGMPPGPVDYGPNLFLGADSSGADMAYKGALVCAPQNSGKTRLILRWCLAANKAGMSTLIIDVKGNIMQALEGQLQGRVYHVTTNPSDMECDGINLLSGMGQNTPEGRQRIRQLVDAILPKEGWEAGQQAYFHQNHVNWLTGLIQLVFLYAHYYPEHFPNGEPDLSMVYDIAANEDQLYRMIDLILGAERKAVEIEEPDLPYWLAEIALLIDRAHGGQRTGEYSYRMLTQSITNALRPFSRFGTLYWKTASGRAGRPNPYPDRRFFTLETLNDPAEPVTIILAAREQDIDDAATFASMVVKRLQHLLFDRMSDPSLSRPVLLLLDETRRIRSFVPDEYITFARQARAGCVIVYQSLEQIGEERKIKIILENVGTQIYLSSLTGQTAAHFISMLPKRRRPVFSSSLSSSLSGEVSSATQVGFELIEYLSALELYRLPAGNWPAIVYLNTQPRRDPILVDMDEGGAA
jgi:hypothetical protein